MKRTTIFSTLVLTALLAIGAYQTASAQVPIQKTGNKALKQQNLDDSGKSMVKAAKECRQAVKITGKALPIYHGHRVKAMELTKLAIKEIRLGLAWDRKNNKNKNNTKNIKNNQTQNLDKQVKALDNLKEEPTRKYTDKQIQNSNKKLQRAGTILTQAKADLQAASKEYNGHRANAIKLVSSALDEINLALNGSGSSVKP